MTQGGPARGDDAAGPEGAVSVAERIRAALRADILSLSLPPGAPLTETALAAQFDASRNTVREALRLLVEDGLVVHHRHRGAMVREPTADDVADLFAARRAVEVGVAHQAAAWGPRARHGLEPHLVAMERAVAAGDRAGVVAADLAFHAALVELGGSARLARFAHSVQQELRLALVTVDRALPDPHKVAEHRRLLDRVEAGDGEGLAVALAAHLDAASADLARVLA